MRLLILMAACLSAAAAATLPEDVMEFWEDSEVPRMYPAAAQAEASCDDLTYPAITQPLGKAVLVLGLSGSGKSTLTLFLVGSDKLTAVETMEGSDEFIISDEDDKIGGDTVSKTMYPNLIPYEAGNLSFVDCPGFADNRGMCIQIKQALAINAVFRQSRQIKVLLTAGYHSLGVESSRLKEFIEFLKQSVRLLRMMDKYVESVGLVLTKVPNDFNRKTRELKTDVEMLKPKMLSLTKLLNSLKDNTSEAVAPEGKAGVVRLLEELVVEKGGSYPKVALFRRPIEEGSLKNSELLMKGFSHIHSMIKNNMKFVSPSPGDFGYTLSPQATLEAGRFLKETVDKLNAAALGLAKLSVKETASGITGLGRVEQLQESARRAKECLAELAAMQLPGEKQAHSCKQVGRLDGWVQQMERQASLCSQLMDIGGGDLEVDALAAVRALQDAQWYLGEVGAVLAVAADVANATKSSSSNNNPVLNQLAKELRDHSVAAAEFQDKFAVQQRLQRARTRGLDAALQQLQEQVLARAEEAAGDLIEIADGIDTSAKKMEEIIADLRKARDCASTTGAALSQLQVPPRCAQGSGTQSFHQLRSLAEALGALVATGHVSREAAAEGMPGSELGRAEEHVQELQAWYSTLRELRRRLGSSEVLREGAPSRERVEQLFRESVPEEHANLSEALEQRLQAYWSDPSTSTASTALRTLLQQLQGHDITTSTAEAGGVTTLTVSGYVVPLSKAVPLIKKGFQRMEIVAAHTLLMDKTLTLQHYGNVTRLTLVAPRIMVVGKYRSIRVGGQDGVSYDNPADEGQPGKPGRPGQPGGQVVLIAGRVEGDSKLTVYVSGGRGGPGQQGGKGADGLPGTAAYIPQNDDQTKYYCEENRKPGECWLNTYTNGTPGRDGAVGGVGGLGAQAGVAELFVPEIDRIWVSKPAGGSGDGNKGGPGGAGGRQGIQCRIVSYISTKEVVPKLKKRIVECKWSDHYAAKGMEGKASVYLKGRESPRSPEPLPPAARYHAHVLYRRTVRELLGANILDDDLVEDFLNDLADGKVVPRRDADDVKLEAYELAKDAKLLEEECSRLGRPAAYAPHYEGFLRVLQGLVSDPALVPDSVQPVLGAAYSVVVTSLRSLRSSRVPDLVSDVSGYLAKVGVSVQLWHQQALRLRDARTEERAAAASRAAQEAHRALSRALLDGIRDRQNFLSGTLTKAMYSIETEAFETQHILSERLAKDEKTEKRLKKKLSSLKAIQAIMNICSKAFNVAGDLLSLVSGPVGTAAKIGKVVGKLPFDIVGEGLADETKKLEAEINTLTGNIEILKTLIPLLRKFEQAVNAARDVTTAIGVRELKLSDKIGTLRKALASWDVNPAVAQSISEYLNLLDDAMTHQQEILEQLEQAANHQLMGNLIVSTVAPAGAFQDSFSLSLRTLEAELAELSASGVLLAEYNTAVAGFRQWAFPFSSDLIDSIPVPRLLRMQLSLERLADAAIEDVTSLKNTIDTEDTTLTAMKRYLRLTSPLSVSPQPLTASLLVWRGREHEDAIRALLRGEETPLLGAVEAALQGDGLDAVKVAEVQLYLSSEDPQLQQRLDAAMQSARVNLTHSGVHHYRCGRSLYRIVTPAQTLLYSVEKNTNGSPSSANAVYRTLERVQPVLSPFTTWVAVLSGSALRSLEKEAARVDAHLLARVSYVRGYACPASLGRSYQEDTCPAGQPAKQLPVLGNNFLQPLLSPTSQA